MRIPIAIVFALCALVSLWADPGNGHSTASGTQDITSLSIEDLMKIEITTVSKREQPLRRTAAAVHVITREDIRRSGAASIPDLLGTVPGLHVSQLNTHQWAISARGFSELYASNMLVLLDGRNLYTPFFSGVYWDMLDVPLEDIERIEVVRGPGGTTWGANAVNGVINIITRHTQHTQGMLIAANGGMRDRSSALARFGGTIGADTSYRLYMKHTDAAPFDAVDGTTEVSDWQLTQGGFRLDSTTSRFGGLTIQGTFFGGAAQDSSPLDIVNFRPTSQRLVRQSLQGTALQAEWQMRLGGRISQTVRTYVDSWRRQGFEDGGTLTTDLDWQQTWQSSDHHALTYGAGIRHAEADYQGSFTGYKPILQDKCWLSAFVQSSHDIMPEKLNLSIGSKFEHDSLSGLNAQPSVRLSYSPRSRLELWTAVSRAVRTPNWAERNLEAPIATLTGPTGIQNRLVVIGSERMGPEDLMAYEAGMRLQVGSGLSFDVAAFTNRYNDLQSLDAGNPRFDDPLNPARVTTFLEFANGMAANSRGIEIAAQWQLLPVWKLSASYTAFGIKASTDRGAEDHISMERVYSAPRHQHGAISSVDLPKRMEWTTTWSYSGERAYLRLKSLHRLDTNLQWHATPSLDVGLGCRNLTGQQVVQYDSIRALGVMPELAPGRRLFLQAAFRF